jgi:hypothetical protein
LIYVQVDKQRETNISIETTTRFVATPL